MIEILPDFPASVVAVRCSGRVSKFDYETVLVPAVKIALDQHPKVRVYYETADDFSGLEAGAIWEDFKVGMAHLARWERVAHSHRCRMDQTGDAPVRVHDARRNPELLQV